MASGRRLITLVVALALVGAPAVALRAFCVGKSCADDAAAATAVPFCRLPADLRAQIENGYRQGRSPDVMATRNANDLAGGTAGSSGADWPYVPLSAPQTSVPIAFFGHGVVSGELPRGTGLDDIAPTLARLMGYDRPHPEIRSGAAIAAAVRPDADPPLIVEITWQGAGSETFGGRRFEAWTKTLASGGDVAWITSGMTGSLPEEPAATLTTIGTGGLPSEHGITGNLIRDKRGAPVPAWSADAPTSVIATLADDWDHATGQAAKIGLIAPDQTDQGLVGGTWYLSHDRDDLVFGRPDPVTAVERLLGAGYGTDRTTDILGVVLAGHDADGQTRAIVDAVRASVPDATFVVTASGFTARSGGSGASIGRAVDRAVGSTVVAAVVPGGLFLDQAAMAANDITSDDVVRALDAMRASDGTPQFADAYPGFAISFSRYC